MYLQCSHGFWGQYFSGWCFTHQYKNTTQFYFYAALLSSQNTNQQKIIRSGANIGGGMCVYTTKTTDKELTRKFSYPNGSGSHDFGFLIIDQNRTVDIYAVGILCGVKTILKTSYGATPSLSGHILSIPLTTWSSVFLITTETNVTIN